MVESLSSCLFPRSRRRAAAALADARPVPFWTDRPERPDPRAPLTGAAPRTDLLVVGGGFTGLWAAIQAKEADPARDVVVIEAGRLADGASGSQRRLHGSVASPTGSPRASAAGPRRWRRSTGSRPRTSRPSRRSLTAYGIDADFHVPGELTLALTEHQVLVRARVLRAAPGSRRARSSCSTPAQARARVDSPRYLRRDVRPRGRARRPGAPRLGPGPRRRVAGRQAPRAHARNGIRHRGRRRAGHAGRGLDPCAARRHRHERVAGRAQAPQRVGAARSTTTCS